MKRLVFLFLLIPSLALGDQIIWTAPSTYVDNTAIPEAKVKAIKYRLYVDGSEFAVAEGGVTSWEGTLPQQPGEVRTYTCTAELDGQTSESSPPTTFAYFVPTNAPGAVTIQLGR